MAIKDMYGMDVAAMLRMTDYLVRAAQDLQLKRAERLYRDAFDAVALGASAQDGLDGLAAASTPSAEQPRANPS